MAQYENSSARSAAALQSFSHGSLTDEGDLRAGSLRLGEHNWVPWQKSSNGVDCDENVEAYLEARQISVLTENIDI